MASAFYGPYGPIDPNDYTSASNSTNFTWSVSSAAFSLQLLTEQVTVPDEQIGEARRAHARRHLLRGRSDETPDLIEELLGVRVWRVEVGEPWLGWIPDELWLQSINKFGSRETLWRPGEPFYANCIYGHWYNAGGWSSCSCGVYAMKPAYRKRLLRKDEGWLVYGTVALSGVVQVAEFGYRAERARVHSLSHVRHGDMVTFPWEKRKLLRQLAQTYNVPIRRI